MSSSESALVVLVPEAEALVKPFREKHDPSANAGMPAHVTVLFPFKPPAEISASVLEELQDCFAQLVPFDCSLRAIRRFRSEVIYLAPDPDEPFRQLTLAICDRYPDTPPYGGKFTDVVPHLTVAQVQDERDLDRIAGDLALAAQGMLPIMARAETIALMDNSSGCWQVRKLFALGRGARQPRGN